MTAKKRVYGTPGIIQSVLPIAGVFQAVVVVLLSSLHSYIITSGTQLIAVESSQNRNCLVDLIQTLRISEVYMSSLWNVNRE